jgi:hypothetical protein
MTLNREVELRIALAGKEPDMTRITPFLWFDTQAEEAAKLRKAYAKQ